ncbi:MAG: hypothetical protein ACK541_03600 [Burkholderiales bacterium]
MKQILRNAEPLKANQDGALDALVLTGSKTMVSRLADFGSNTTRYQTAKA